MATFEFPKKLPKAWIKEIERNGRVGSDVHGLKVVAKDERGTIVHIGKDSFKILHNGKNSSNFGYETKDAEADTGPNIILGSWYSCPNSGTANSITVYLKQYGSYTPKIKCAIYKKADYTLVGNTEEWTLTAGWDNWKTLNIISGGTLEATDYFLVTWISSVVYVYRGILASKGRWSSTTYDGWPSPWSPNTSGEKFSLYCTYTVPPPAGGVLVQVM
jgi:hypothetical protein